MATYSYFVKPQAFYTDIASVTPAQPMVFDYADIPVFRFSFLPNAIQAGDTLVFASDDDMIFYSDDPGNILHSASCMIINKHVVTEEEAAALKVEMPINTRTIKFRDTVNGKIRPVDVMTALYVLRDTGDDKAYSVLAKGRGLCNAIIADYDALPEPITTGEYYTKSELDKLLAEKAEASALQAHVDDADIHVTLDDKSKWDSKADIQDITDAVDGLATVATTGSYNDLTDKPVIPGTPEIQAPVDVHNAAPDAHAQLFGSKQDKITPEAPLPVANVSGLATVATTGSYNDLADQPTIPVVPAKVSEFENDADYQTGEQVGNAISTATAPLATTESVNAGLAAKQDKIDADHKLPVANVEGLSTVATTGSYNDLTDQPTIPAAANDAKITITQGGVEKGSFTLNQADPKTIEVDAGGGAADEVNYLTLTAEEAGSTLHLDKVGDATQLTARLQYRLNGGDWIDYNWTELAGDPITLTNIGDKVQFKATDQNEQFSVRINASYRFIMTGRIAGSGSIMTLLDETDQLRDLTGKENCFVSLFVGCTSLTEAPELPATTLAQYCYENLFRGAGLIKAPELPATTLAQSCYKGLLYGCTSLTKAPALPATTLTPWCYANLFAFCSNLTTAPELPATTLTPGCYANLFESCYNLTKAPALPATTLAQYCYEKLFANCYHLTTAPELPAITLAESCYSFLFQGCSRLNEAPKLPATTLAKKCYQYLFQNCTALEKISIAYSGADNPSAFSNWVMGGASTGTIVCPEGFPSEEVPADWTRVTSYDDEALDAELKSKADKADIHDATVTLTQGGATKGSFTLNQAGDATIELDAGGGAKDNSDYLTFTRARFNFIPVLSIDKNGDASKLTARLKYRINGGEWIEYNWVGLEGEKLTLGDLVEGDTIQFSAVDQNDTFSVSENDFYQFKVTKNNSAINECFAVSGNIMSLIDSSCSSKSISNDYAFANLFKDCTYLLPSGIKLPAIHLTKGCYLGLFSRVGSNNPFMPPDLPAIKMKPYSYQQMFENCKLYRPPVMNCSEYTVGCFLKMFSLGSFYNGSLPNIDYDAAVNYSSACKGMFSYLNCDNLEDINLRLISVDSSACESMFASVKSIKKVKIIHNFSGYDGGKNHFRNMFESCNNLSEVELIPYNERSDLHPDCLYGMFAGCQNLKKIKVGFKRWYYDDYGTHRPATTIWLYGVPADGVFICPPELDNSTRDSSHVPAGWTIYHGGNSWDTDNSYSASVIPSSDTCMISPSGKDTPVITVATALTLSASPEAADTISYCECVLDVAEGASVTAGDNLTIVDAPTAGKRNIMEVRWQGGTAKLRSKYVEDLPVPPAA